MQDVREVPFLAHTVELVDCDVKNNAFQIVVCGFSRTTDDEDRFSSTGFTTHTIIDVMCCFYTFDVVVCEQFSDYFEMILLITIALLLLT